MRNEMTTGRRIAVVVALALLALFTLHPACPPEIAAHGPVGSSAELCHHHGDTHHLSAAAPALAAVQTAVPLAFDTAVAVAFAGPGTTSPSCPWRSEHST